MIKEEFENDRDCEHCSHYKPSENGIMGCESWECAFKPKALKEGKGGAV